MPQREFLRDKSGREVEVTGLSEDRVAEIAGAMAMREYLERARLSQIMQNLRTPILRRNR